MKREEIIGRSDQIRHLVEDLLILEAVFTTRRSVVLRGIPRVPFADLEATVRARLQATGYTGTVEVAATAEPGAPRDAVLISVKLDNAVPARFPVVNAVLFLFTVGTTTLFGGVEFAVWFLAILLFHEFGHFTLARRRRIDASWPYFIPAPNILGTFGAFIQLRSPIRDRPSLLDMAVAGPLAGFVVAVAALIVGLSQSTVVAPETTESGLFLGESLLFHLLQNIVLPGIPDGQTVLLHPVAFAGWAGLLVTMFNLLPMGQLDGGHIAYALFRRHQRRIAYVVMAGLAVAAYWWPWWILWVGIGIFMRPKHPPTLLDEIPIGRTRQFLGWLSFVIFILCFMPVPFTVVF
ncbi:MAG TPA: site-2 protease family protein [Acidobacteriota bacterium]|nr:site-2 protease family protein [Acidobacteriota bacterium]